MYALLTNPLLLIAIGFLSGGFVAINKFGMLATASRQTTYSSRIKLTLLFLVLRFWVIEQLRNHQRQAKAGRSHKNHYTLVFSLLESLYYGSPLL